ncbi:hypothetical protein CQW39_10460 [Streptomyces griseofuscus]|uniref:Gram-positive cocci surface proteins LPxTG domain-containing protein n=2 Tax=Streptomyces griseofuscus TaxID=146922 RepID=A0A3R8WSN4_9ACTN|nr:hypothetical protein CQW39_10460 [Streptomyces griseofuscus]RRQ85023.1 hypothetical protein CQW44_18670 [Streptomyces griseofuscus]
MFMRLRTSLSPGRISLRPLGLAAAAVLAPSPASALGGPLPVAAATPAPSCAAPGEHAFPLATRIRGGPTEYQPGDGSSAWYIDLTNTTRRSCAGIHPVVVLVDDRHELKAGQARLDFDDGSRVHPVTFESTDEKELVGVLDAPGFGGFSVLPGKTVSVRVRLALTQEAAVPDQVTASAAAVQRRGQDGDWVGESNAYRFGVGTPMSPAPEPPGDQDGTPVAQDLAGTGTGTGVGQTAGTGGSTGPGTPAPGTGSAGPGTPRPTGTAPDPSLPFARDAQEAGRRARELARTGPALTHGLLAAAGALLCVTGAAFLLARRRR